MQSFFLEKVAATLPAPGCNLEGHARGTPLFGCIWSRASCLTAHAVPSSRSSGENPAPRAKGTV